MPFIIVFNIVVSVLAGVVLLTILGTSVMAKDNKKRSGEVAEKTEAKIEKIRSIAYLVFFAVLVLMILVNLIF